MIRCIRRSMPTWVSTREAYEQYRASVFRPVRFDSFRRYINKGLIRFRKRGNFRQVSEDSLHRFIQRIRSNQIKELPKKKTANRQAKPRKVSSNVKKEVWWKLAENQLVELIQTGKRSKLVNDGIHMIPDSKVRKMISSYVTLVEGGAIKMGQATLKARQVQ